MQSIEEVQAFLQRALREDARSRLTDTGEAWSIMRRDGQTAPDGPDFRATLDVDLAEYGFAVLDGALAMRSLDRRSPLARDGFGKSGRVFEALVKNGDPTDSKRGFQRVVAAASFHLGGYSAVAYALFAAIESESLNLNVAESCLVKLILRDMVGVRDIAKSWLTDPDNQDESLVAMLSDQVIDRDDVLATILNSVVCRALATYEFALKTGDTEFVLETDRLLKAALDIAGDRGIVTLWWVIRITQHLLADLWPQTLHQALPLQPLEGDVATYEKYRKLFIASLLCKKTAEIELWPSQIDAARRTADSNDDLVVSLPTSAGKTRIAELATLTTLSQGRRVLIMTPLRALSAQTERSFRSAFTPLGATVSSLYGKSGLSAGDASSLRADRIVVSTPEKLDFALRSDPNIIDDIGLIVLDEGHLIGPSEREVRYEILVQRLLKRADAADRRIVCLSAVLPEGDALDDMTDWIRSDAEGDPVHSEWRPTRQRFGTLEWYGHSATLHYDLDDNGPFVSGFIEAHEPIRPERLSRPRDLKDLSLMAAWRFAAEGKRTLIFITQANWVEGFGDRAIDLVKRGYLTSLLEDESSIKDAITIGTEWLGADHPAVACLNIGVALHHGKLPSPFLREVERLLVSGAIKVTAASPTLAQGLNLNAAVLLVPYLVREGTEISSEELANVAGRAGRAFVDTEGLILHVMKDRHDSRRNQWRMLVSDVKGRTLRSGLLTMIDRVIKRLADRGVKRNENGYEYLANSREAWLEEPEDAEGEALEDMVAKLDAIVFGLVEALDADAENLPELLDEALNSSLWARQVDRLKPGVRELQMIVLKVRARLIWNSTTTEQRRGHFAMGVGLDTGLKLDELAGDLANEIDRADLAAMQGDLDTLYEAVRVLADALLVIKPFVPYTRNRPGPGFGDVLRQWLAGAPIADIGENNIGVIEDAIVYRLVWAMEVLRARRTATGGTPDNEVIAGAAAACVDTGLPNYRMTLLVRAGLPSRTAAAIAIDELNPINLDNVDLRNWLGSDEVAERSTRHDWPSATTASLWRRFREEMISAGDESWTITRLTRLIAPLGNTVLPVGHNCRVEADVHGGPAWAMTADYKPLGRFDMPMVDETRSIQFAHIDTADGAASIVRIGSRQAE